MSPGKIRQRTLAERSQTIQQMLQGIDRLPLASLGDFLQDPDKVAAGESYLRRALEALFDICRHILAKGFAIASPEYAATARELWRAGILDPDLAERLGKMARYRNRMVHFYDEILPEELYGILTQYLGDIETVLAVLESWTEAHPERLDETL
jgi:uncharacterized protein YutE (UPF0331/DUF86 family)